VTAPQAFVEWMITNRHIDRQFGYIYQYHSRSDAHSKALCRLIVGDLVKSCLPLRKHAQQGRIVFGINSKFKWLSSGKSKNLDLAIGPPKDGIVAIPSGALLITEGQLGDVWIACEAKAVMTEHKKSQPRVFDELSSSHEIVHSGNVKAIAAGITVVNLAETFVSPLRQKVAGALHVSQHNQPHVVESMVAHLRGLSIRESLDRVGFDAYATIVVDCDNQGRCALVTSAPAPQPGERDHYDVFIERLSAIYAERFG
jgi:hypothetical protein